MDRRRVLHVSLSRGALICRRNQSPGWSGTEDPAGGVGPTVNSAWGILVGSSNDFTILNDGSDSTYFRQDDLIDEDLGFTGRRVGWGGHIAGAAGSDVVLVGFVVRCELTAGTLTSAYGVLVAPATPSQSFTPPGSVGNVTVGPFSKPDGGNWTPTDIAALQFRIQIDGDTSMLARIYGITPRLFYA